MNKLPRRLLGPRPSSSSPIRLFATNLICRSSAPTPTPTPRRPQLPLPLRDTHKAHTKLADHPQAPLPTGGFGPFTFNVETKERLTFKEREEEKAKEYLYSAPDPNMPLPPLLLRPPGLADPPEKGKGHGKETRK